MSKKVWIKSSLKNFLKFKFVNSKIFFSNRCRHDEFKRSHMAFQVHLFYGYMTTPAFPAKHEQF